MNLPLIYYLLYTHIRLYTNNYLKKLWKIMYSLTYLFGNHISSMFQKKHRKIWLRLTNVNQKQKIVE